MKIIGVESICVDEYSNLVLVCIHTDEGLVGLGETYRNAQATVAYIHETCAPYLLEKNPLDRESISYGFVRQMGNRFNGFPTRSIEIRGNSAIDIALWDLCGQAMNVPIYQLLGGIVNDKIRIYNTCAGSSYNNKARVDGDTKILRRDNNKKPKIAKYEDHLLQVHSPATLAKELLDEGITAMKIWPFDVFALRNKGQHISPDEMKEALWPIEQIRDAVGNKIDVMLEYHGLWHLPAALEIAAAVADYGVKWQEDPISMQNFDDLLRYRDNVQGLVCGSENLGTLPWYREAFKRGAIDVANFDIAWIGGISEAQRVIHLTEAFDRHIAPHDCTGPVTLVANVHLLASARSGLIAETVRSYCKGFYKDILDEIPRIKDGYIYPLTGPGLGAKLSQEFLGRKDIRRRITGKQINA